ncbi:MAG: arylesterase [Myxococcales bacterium]|nr:arylesterase [Myxococcales bacterium]
MADGDRGVEDSRRVVLFLGDSLSAGYGLPLGESFPARIQQRIDAEGLPFRVVNAGVSGDTTAGGLRRIEWLLRQPVDTLVIQLGGNDMLRGLDLNALRSNLRRIAERTRKAHPGAALVVAGMQAPANLGRDYASAFRASFEQLAAEFDAAYIPFLLEGVAMQPGLNQSDGIHPTAEGHERVAETVWGVLAPVLRSRSEAPVGQ